MAPRWIRAFALFGLLVSSPAAPTETIGLRFVVGDELGNDEPKRQKVIRTLSGYVRELNDYFSSSEVKLAAIIVRVDFSPVANSDADAILGDMKNQRAGFENLFATADEYGADFTFAVVGALQLRGLPGCGKAFAVNKTTAEIASTRRAFAVVDYRCGARTLAHELGHLMGLNHGNKVDECEPGRGHAKAIVPYANGYAEGACDGRPDAEKFGTIMVGGWMKAINGDGRSNLKMYSNPRIRDPRCGRRGICGDEQTGDEARALNENARIYANHETPDVHTLPYASPEFVECISGKYRYREINELTDLSCAGTNIAATAGIAQLTALRKVDLSNNRIRDFPDLQILFSNGLQLIDLRGNKEFDCRVLESLPGKHQAQVLVPNHCRTSAGTAGVRQ